MLDSPTFHIYIPIFNIQLQRQGYEQFSAELYEIPITSTQQIFYDFMNIQYCSGFIICLIFRFLNHYKCMLIPNIQNEILRSLLSKPCECS